MSYKYMGRRDGNEYYKKGADYYKKEWDSNLNAYVYVYVHCFWDKGGVTSLKNGKQMKVTVDQINIGDEVLTSDGFEKTSTGFVVGLSHHHLVYIGNEKMKPAHDLEVNDLVETIDGSSKIISITKDVAKVRSIITMNGELIVYNIRVS
eukprot:434055_1